MKFKLLGLFEEAFEDPAIPAHSLASSPATISVLLFARISCIPCSEMGTM